MLSYILKYLNITKLKSNCLSRVKIHFCCLNLLLLIDIILSERLLFILIDIVGNVDTIKKIKGILEISTKKMACLVETIKHQSNMVKMWCLSYAILVIEV